MARGRANQRRVGDGGNSRPLSTLRSRRDAGGDRVGGSRRRLGLHQPVGSGLSVGLLHAQRLRDSLRPFHDPATFALEWDRVTETDLAPFYWNQLAADHARLEAMAALREGRTVDVRSPSILPPQYADAARAMLYDADVFRAVLETLGCLALPQEVFARPGIWDKVQATAGEPISLPGPTRTELLALLA